MGRDLEPSQAVNQAEIARVLSGNASYDDLSAAEQAVVRAEWEERIKTLHADLDLAIEFRDAGQTWSEWDGEAVRLRS